MSGNPGKSTLVEGVLQGGAHMPVILEEMAVREYIPVDTATCDPEGRFQIEFRPEQNAFYVLRTGGKGYITLLIEPGQQITLKGSYGQPDQYSLSGSRGSEELMELSARHKKTLNELGDITRLVMEFRDLPDYPEKKMRLDLKFDSITTSFRDYSFEFITRHQESLSILIALYNLYGQGLPVFDPVKDFQTYLFVDSLLQIHHPGFEAAQLLHAQVLEANATEQINETDHRPEVGDIAPDFVSSRPDGSQLALSDYKGQYVLLSFWAGWSNPSREENRYLKEIWKTKGTLPFRILQVSLDHERETWIRSVEEDGLAWDHVSDLQRWESAIAILYGIDKIPSNYLIDPEGKIIARDLLGRDLIEKFESLHRNL
jgi:peroxiredoxin